MIKFSSLLVLFLFACPIHAQMKNEAYPLIMEDTTYVSSVLHPSNNENVVDNPSGFRPRQLAAPIVLLGMGAWGMADNSPIDWVAQRARWDMNPKGKETSVDEYFQYVPTASHILLGFIPGIKSRHNFRDRALAAITANILMAAMTNTMKYTIKEQRPDSHKRNSFPSGHTATAFTGAELMRIDYGWGPGMAAYAVASTTAFLRVWNKRHWVGDVLAGAGIGILSAQAGYWMLPVWHRLFHIPRQRKKSGFSRFDTPNEDLYSISSVVSESRLSNRGRIVPTVVAIPFYEYDSRSYGLSCAIVFP